MFQSARIKLTVWYLLIIMAIAVIFSIAIYRVLDYEFAQLRRQAEIRQERITQLSQVFGLPPGDSRIPVINTDAIAESETRLRLFLFGINLIILSVASSAGYFLAGRTLQPIAEMIDEQNRFISDSSHELRTPLTALKSEIEVTLRDKKLTLTQAKKLLASNLEEVNMLKDLSDNLIKLAQFQKRSDTALFTTVSIAEVIDDAVKKVAVLAKQRNITIANKIHDKNVEANKQGLVELFVILLDNAIKYSPDNTAVSLTSVAVDHTVTIAIRDQGIGLEEKDIAHLFDRFYRADAARTKIDASGYGLGLAIAYNIVQSHNGSIKAENNRTGGATFSVTLPTKQPKQLIM